MPMSTKSEMRGDPGVMRNYGRLLVELSAVVPDGIVAFFVSYCYMDQIISKWHDMGILQVRQSGTRGTGWAVGGGETRRTVDNISLSRALSEHGGGKTLLTTELNDNLSDESGWNCNQCNRMQLFICLFRKSCSTSSSSSRRRWGL